MATKWRATAKRVALWVEMSKDFDSSHGNSQVGAVIRTLSDDLTEAQSKVKAIPPDLRDLDNKPFNAESYNRWRKVQFDGGEAHGRKEATKEIRRLIAPALRNLIDAIGEQGRTGTPHQTRRLYGYVATIDSATRPTKARNEKTRRTT